MAAHGPDCSVSDCTHAGEGHFADIAGGQFKMLARTGVEVEERERHRLLLTGIQKNTAKKLRTGQACGRGSRVGIGVAAGHVRCLSAKLCNPTSSCWGNLATDSRCTDHDSGKGWRFIRKLD